MWRGRGLTGVLLGTAVYTEGITRTAVGELTEFYRVDDLVTNLQVIRRHFPQHVDGLIPDYEAITCRDVIDQRLQKATP